MDTIRSYLFDTSDVVNMQRYNCGATLVPDIENVPPGEEIGRVMCNSRTGLKIFQLKQPTPGQEWEIEGVTFAINPHDSVDDYILIEHDGQRVRGISAFNNKAEADIFENNYWGGTEAARTREVPGEEKIERTGVDLRVEPSLFVHPSYHQVPAVYSDVYPDMKLQDAHEGLLARSLGFSLSVDTNALGLITPWLGFLRFGVEGGGLFSGGTDGLEVSKEYCNASTDCELKVGYLVVKFGLEVGRKNIEAILKRPVPSSDQHDWDLAGFTVFGGGYKWVDYNLAVDGDFIPKDGTNHGGVVPGLDYLEMGVRVAWITPGNWPDLEFKLMYQRLLPNIINR